MGSAGFAGAAAWMGAASYGGFAGYCLGAVVYGATTGGC